MDTTTQPSTMARRPRRSHAERSQATRHDLVAAAISVIAERGLAQASTFEIAKAAGVTPGAVQHHFGGKKDLILRAAAELVQSDDGNGAAAVWPAPSVPLRRRAREAVSSAWRQVYGRQNYVTMWSIFMACRTDEELLHHMAAEREALRIRMAEDFLSAFPELRATTGHEAFANLVFSAMRGMGVQEMFRPPPALCGEQLAQLAEIIVHRCERAAGAPAIETPGAEPPIAGH